MTSLINFLFECLNLKHIKRSGWYYAGVSAPESVAEHSLHAAQIAYVLAKMEWADAHKVTAMLTWHDIGEIRIGDIHWLGGKYITEKRSIEQKVVSDQLEDVGQRADIEALIAEYTTCETLEARVAKDADILNGVFQCKAYLEQGHELMDTYLKNFESRLKTASAKAMYTDILQTKSFEWLLPHEENGYQKN